MKEMTYEDMKHKMGETNWEYLRRMLKVSDVPEPVMVRYFQYKRYLDPIGGRITVMDLLRIAMDCGFDLETGLFGAKYADEDVNPETGDGAEEIIDDALNTKDDGTGINAEDFVEAQLAKDVDPNAETTLAFEVEPKRKEGDPVTFYLDGSPVQGVIKGHLPKGATEEVTYKVDYEGETLEIDEDDIE
jgi:hypothetical protein